MLRVGTCLLFIILFVACKHKPVSLSGDEPVNADAFFAAFTKVSLPYYVADTNLEKLADTTVIGYKVISQFIPDTIFKKILPNL